MTPVRHAKGIRRAEPSTRPRADACNAPRRKREAERRSREAGRSYNAAGSPRHRYPEFVAVAAGGASRGRRNGRQSIESAIPPRRKTSTRSHVSIGGIGSASPQPFRHHSLDTRPQTPGAGDGGLLLPSDVPPLTVCTWELPETDCRWSKGQRSEDHCQPDLSLIHI